MKTPKLSKKVIVIAFSVFGILLFLGIFIILFSQLSNISSKEKTVADGVINENTTDNLINTDTEGNSNVGLITIGGYKDDITLQLNNDSGFSCDLKFTPNGFLTEKEMPASLFIKSNKAKHIYDPDERILNYEVGTVSGIFNGVTIAPSTKYYVAIYQVYYPDDNAVVSKEWQNSSTEVRYFINDDIIYVLSGSSFLNSAISTGIGSVVSSSVDPDNSENIIYIQEKSILESNVVLLSSYHVNDTANFVADSTFPSQYYHHSDNTNTFVSYTFTSTKGAKFSFNDGDPILIPSEFLGYTAIDDYKGLKILVNDRKQFILINREGIVQLIDLKLLEDTDTVNYIWNDGTTSSDYYNSSYGTCESSTDTTYGYVFEDLSPSSLKEIGTIKETPIFEKINLANDSYTQKVYNEDYLKDEKWKVNALTADDFSPLSYEQYLAKHPVIYILDAYGDYVRYTNGNFFMAGGCAKPAIYLYPTQTTDITIKVVPNGKLTFTYPAYGDGWNVTADSEGYITNKADGKIYNYLWWDSYTYNLDIPNDGFVVATSEIHTFLDKKLLEMNLNTKEISEFKAYWIPKIQNEDSKYVFVTFLFNNDVNQIAQLSVNPKPDNMFRVFMLYKPVSKQYIVKPLIIQKADRTGYALIEWGGAKL